MRKATGNQSIALVKSDEPNEFTAYLKNQFEVLEHELQLSLGHFAKSQPAGKWAMSQLGIGPVIAGGLLAHIKPEHCKVSTHVYKFAGLAPGQKRKKGERIDFNPDLKRLAWIIGESFVKVSNKEDSLYGKIYKQRYQYETEKNAKGDYADQAAIQIKIMKDKTTDTYAELSQGRLPKGAIHARSKRYAAKMFLSHFSQILWETNFDEPWGTPYAIAHLNHVDYIAPLNYDLKLRKVLV